MIPWMLVLTLLLLGLGGLSVDLWRAFSERRELAAVADAAAVAGASALDESAFRAAGGARLDTGLARQRAQGILATAGPAITSSAVQATPAAVAVTAAGEVPLHLARLLAPGVRTVRIEVEAVSGPQLGG